MDDVDASRALALRPATCPRLRDPARQALQGNGSQPHSRAGIT